jgi:hypothetical protein
MAFRPLVSVPHIGALALAAVGFMVMFAIAQLLASRVPPVFAMILLAAPLIGAGMIVGYRASRAPLMHGLILGISIGVFAIITAAVLSGMGMGMGDVASILMAGGPAILYMAIPGIILCSLGAVLGDYLRDRASRS